MNSCVTIEIRRKCIASILGSTETSVNLYHTVQRYIPEDTAVGVVGVKSEHYLELA
jgi:hypothetical protein